MNEAQISELIGKTLKACVREGETVLFECEEGTRYSLNHHQDCCESVTIDDICGELSDLVGSPILQAEEPSSEGAGGDGDDSFTWTFYRFHTAKGSVVIKWYGTSNGYYSESVQFDRL